MKFSIIIATLDREDVLNKCIKSLTNQTFKDFEVIIVDQGRLKKVEEIKEKYKFVKYIKIDEKGLSNARNIGIEKSLGELVCFLDDDAEYSYNFLEMVLENFEKYNLDGLCGKIKDKYSNKPFLKGMDSTRKQLNYKTLFSTFASSAIVIKKSVLDDIGVFDNRLGVGKEYGSGEETDILLRLIYKNKKIFYVPECEVYHPVEEKSLDSMRAYFYGKGYGALCKKHIFKFNNYRFIIYYIKMLIRPVIAMILNVFKNNKRKFFYYSLKGRIVGMIKFNILERCD